MQFSVPFCKLLVGRFQFLPERFIVAIAQALNFPSRSSMAAIRSITGSRLTATTLSTVSAIFVDNSVDAKLLLFRVDKFVDTVDAPLASLGVDIVDSVVDVPESSLRMRCAA